MSDLETRLSWDLSDLDEGIARVVSRGRDFAPFFRKMKTPVRKEQREHGKRREGPEGKWKAWTPSYRAERRRRRRRGQKTPRRMLGKLTRSHRVSISPFGLEIASPIPWAGLHMDGGTVRGRRIEARPFLWWSDPFVDDVAEKALDFVWGLW